MTQFNLSPMYIKLHYSCSGMEHEQTIPVKNNGSPTIGTDPSLLTKSGGNRTFTDFIEEYAAAILPFFGDSMSLLFADCWSQPTTDDDPVLIFTDTLTGAGSNVSDTVLAVQLVGTFRTLFGHLYRNYLMETANSPNTHFSFVEVSGAYASFVDFITGDDSCVVGRDGAFLLSFLNGTTKTNDILRKKRDLV